MSATLECLVPEVPRLVTGASCRSSFINNWREDFHGNF